MCFEFGNECQRAIDIQEVRPNGSVQDVRMQVRRTIDIVGKGGGYILAGSHTIQADTKVDNLIAMLEEARG